MYLNRFSKKRKGTSFAELIIYMLLTSFAFVLMVQSTTYKISNEKSIDVQYDVAAVDAFIVNLYRDYHSAKSVSLEETDSGIIVIVFNLGDGLSETYSFSMNDSACYRNGREQFKASALTAQLMNSQLYMNIKLEDERAFQFTIYK